MKNTKQAPGSRSVKAAIASGCMLLAFGLNALAQPFQSPVGEWDVVMSGSRQAVARFTFNSDHTFTVTEILIPKNMLTMTDPRSLDDSRGGGNDGRGGPTTNSSALPPHTNLYGFVIAPSSVFVPEVGTSMPEVNFTNFNGSSPTGAIWLHDGIPPGTWNFDGTGKLVGFFTEIGPPAAIVTNLIPIGEPVITDCQDVVITGANGQPGLVTVCITNQPYLTNVEYLRLTNAINFSGKVTLNMDDFTKSRLTLLATTPGGKSTFTGVVPIALPDLSGDWFGINRHAGLPYNEFFTLGGLADVNTYAMDGTGAGYLFDGELLVVRQKKFGYVVDITTPHNPPPVVETVKLRVIIGSADLNHGKLSGKGLQETDAGVDRDSFKATLLPPAD